MDVAININRGGGHTKVDCYANYANCDVLAVLIPFLIFIGLAQARLYHVQPQEVCPHYSSAKTMTAQHTMNSIYIPRKIAQQPYLDSTYHYYSRQINHQS